jgi:hypothetical protein
MNLVVTFNYLGEINALEFLFNGGAAGRGRESTSRPYRLAEKPFQVHYKGPFFRGTKEALGPSDETKNSFFPIIYFNSFFRHNALFHHPSRIVRMIIHLVFDHNIWPHLSYPPPPPPPGFYELYKSTIGADEGPGRGTIIRGGAGEKGN